MRAGIEDALERGARHGAPDRLAVDGHEDGRGLGEDDLGRIILDGDHPRLLLGALYREHGLEPIERHGGAAARHHRLETLLVLDSLLRGRRERAF
jgi:hypothetical protein